MVCYHILKIIFMAVPSFQLPFPQVTTWKLLWSDPLKKSTRVLSYFYSFVFIWLWNWSESLGTSTGFFKISSLFIWLFYIQYKVV